MNRQLLQWKQWESKHIDGPCLRYVSIQNVKISGWLWEKNSYFCSADCISLGVSCLPEPIIGATRCEDAAVRNGPAQNHLSFNGYAFLNDFPWFAEHNSDYTWPRMTPIPNDYDCERLRLVIAPTPDDSGLL